MTADMTEFFDVIEPTPAAAPVVTPTTHEIIYRLGVNTGTTQYINIRSRRDELHIRKLCKSFIEHVRMNKDNNHYQKQLYREVVSTPNTNLPRPRKDIAGISVNTYASFIDGIEKNFESGTVNYTEKQWDHVIDIANIAINYFNDVHPTYFNKTLLPIVPVEV
jgi:hypothetical protein